MEEELKCALCKHLFNQPVLLPCLHAVCLACALHHQQPVGGLVATLTAANPAPPSCSSVSELSELSCSDSDKLSILSETDSGVVVSNSSRPSSFIHGHTPPSSSAPTVASTSAPGAPFYTLSCPSCRKVVYFDERGADNLPRYRAMATIVDKFVETKTLGQFCQLCEPGPGQRPAAVFCEQCQVFYCEACREHCHPARGPLAKHALVTAQQGRVLAARCLKEKLKVIPHVSCPPPHFHRDDLARSLVVFYFSYETEIHFFVRPRHPSPGHPSGNLKK